ncbi:MAG: glycosyltransferase family 2 protein [Pirellulales bacterium]
MVQTKGSRPFQAPSNGAPSIVVGETPRDPRIAQMEAQLDELIDLIASDSFYSSSPTGADVCSDETVGFDVSSQLPSPATPELSIVIPCLDEADTIGACVTKAATTIKSMGIAGEVIVADNGSRDGSVEIAASLGARVVHVPERGYGAALMTGIESAAGRFIIMGDADDSYDFRDIPRFYERLKHGAELVQGCRLPSGGGRIMPGAMPWLHKLGNPGLSWLVRRMFGAQIRDVYCGMRGFTKDLYNRLDQRCTGMEFATEMIVKSTVFGARIEQIPITLYKDGRKAHRPHLRTFRDGWKTLRFFLLQSPRWTFLLPSAALTLFGIGGYAAVYLGRPLLGLPIDVHTLLVATLALCVAFQVAASGLLAKVFAGREGLLPVDQRLEAFTTRMSLERGLISSLGLIACGTAVIACQTAYWIGSGFGALEYASTMRALIPAVGAIAIGCQAVSTSFLISVMKMRRRERGTGLVRSSEAGASRAVGNEAGASLPGK